MTSSKPLKIALVAPLAESVPPKLYGGTERIVAYLASSLVSQGHSVTLFATADSLTPALLHPIWPYALRLDTTLLDIESPVIHMLETVARALESASPPFDIVHLHNGFILVPLLKRMHIPHLVTLHHKMALPEIRTYRALLRNTPVVSISNNQRLGELGSRSEIMNYIRTIYHGIPPTLPLGSGQGGYLAFLGSVSPVKGVDTAIAIARFASLPLKIAAKIDSVNQAYYASIAHLFTLPGIEYIGEIPENAKAEFLGGALALLFPVRGEEPFGMVMVEAMMCGTPVIAFPRGSVPEVVDEDVTGFLVEGEEEAVEAIKRVGTLDREEVRRVAMRRFKAERMAGEYVDVYRELLA